MAWKKTRFTSVVLSLSFGVNTAVADELLWWVNNDKVTDVISPYNYEPNPFPVNEQELMMRSREEIIEATTVDPMMLIEARASDLIEKIRNLIRYNKIVKPNLLSIKISGYLEGENGKKVLIDGNWLQIGDKIDTPTQQNNDFVMLVEELKNSAENMYNEIAPEIEDKLQGSKELELTIKTISSDQVIVQDQWGESYVISFVPADL